MCSTRPFVTISLTLSRSIRRLEQVHYLVSRIGGSVRHGKIPVSLGTQIEVLRLECAITNISWVAQGA